MINVVIVDDHPIVREGVKQILAAVDDITVVDEAADGKQFLHLMRGNVRCDVLILDISLPDTNGLDLLRRVREDFADLPVLILSVHPEDQYAVRALRAGASGYLAKDAAPGRLVEAVRAVAAGGRYVSPSLAQRLARDVGDQDARPPHERLSDREYQIFCMIASGKSGNDIGKTLFLSPKTVSTYRTRIIQKTGLKSNAAIARYVVERGLLP